MFVDWQLRGISPPVELYDSIYTKGGLDRKLFTGIEDHLLRGRIQDISY
jgi:hypothetical protein